MLAWCKSFGDNAYIGGRNGITVPWDTKHAVTARLDHELVLASLDDIVWNNVLNAAVTAIASSDT